MHIYIKYSIIIFLFISCKSKIENEPILKEGLISTNIQPPLKGQDELTASDNTTDSKFGTSMALSDDGKTLIIGAPFKSFNNTPSIGAAYIFVKENNKWKEQAKILAPDGVNNLNFGMNLAISGDGNTIVITSYYVYINHVSAGPGIYIFVRSGSTWTLQKRLASIDFITAGYSPGICLSDNGDMLFISSQDITNKTNERYVQIYKRLGTDWLPQTQIKPLEKDVYANFGSSISLSKEGTLMVAANIDSSQTGYVYFFRNINNSWIEELKVRPSKPATNFGTNISISSNGNTALATAPNFFINREGIVYILRRANNTWQQIPIGASDNKSTFNFGYQASLSANGQNAVVISHIPFGFSTAFEVYYYIINGNSWSEQKIANNSIKSQQDLFGSNAIISSDGNSIFIAAPDYDLGTVSNAGLVYVFGR